MSHCFRSCVLVFLFFFHSFYNTKSVVMCLGISAAVCLLVTITSFQTKVEFYSPFSNLYIVWYTAYITEWKSLVYGSLSGCSINLFQVNLLYYLCLVWRDFVHGCALRLLHRHVHLCTVAGNRPPVSICKYLIQIKLSDKLCDKQHGVILTTKRI